MNEYALTYVELDLKRCNLNYGVSPCTAEVGVTGTEKCYNCPATCQDAVNFDPGILTLRFGIATDYLPDDIDCIPSLRSAKTTPQILDPGESMGQRESVAAAFNDHPFNDVGIDKYYAERGFDPYQQGTFWPKMVARWPYIQGSAFRVIRGFVGESLEEMETRHYIVETTAGPGSSNTFSIIAKDYLKLLDGDKAQSPAPSNGVLSASIDTSLTPFTLLPAGIGDLEYPASGFGSIGDEQIEFTRSGDTITPIERGVDFSEISDHEEGETFQLANVYDGEDASDIIYDLITNYTPADPSWITLPDWQLETTTYIGRLYSAKILKPTAVNKLVNELINQVGLLVGSDVINQQIFLKALRQFVPLSTIDDSNRIEDSFQIVEQQNKRVSLVVTYYGLKNPLENLDDEKNYRCILPTFGSTSVAVLEDRQLSIRKIFSRWISVFNRPAAESLNNIIIQRYENAPRRFQDALPITGNPILGSAANFSNRNLQDAQGFLTEKVGQIISVEKTEARYSIVAEEMTFVQQAVVDRLIVIDQDTLDFNLRTVHDQIYAEAESGDNVIVRISTGVKVGSSSPLIRAFDVGDWAAGVNISITIDGRFQGPGGAGNVSSDGGDGGIAFYTRYPVTVDNTNGEIFGGGGGGGGKVHVPSHGSPSFWSGGGGAGYLPGYPGGTTEAGGPGTGGGVGGGPGQNGTTIPGGTAAGLAGAAVDGESFVTWVAEGDIRGPRIN